MEPSQNQFTNRYGFNIFEQNPEDHIEIANKNGLKHIELNLSNKILTPKAFNSSRISNLLNTANQFDITFSIHIPFYINISDILKPIRLSNIKYLMKCLELAISLKAKHVTLHIGTFYWFPVEKWQRRNALNRFILSMSSILPFCEENKLVIAIENVVPIPKGSDFFLLGDNIYDFEFLFSKIDSNCLKFCLDTGHANLAEGAIHYLNLFKDKLCCIHYHDNLGKDDAHLPIGDGNVPWKELADKLIDMQFAGPLISECRNIDPYKSALIFENYFNNKQVEYQIV